MSIDFATLQGLTIPEGVVKQITDAAGRVLWKKSRLPDEYQEVEYLEATGTQYIALDVTTGSRVYDFVTEAKIAWTNVATGKRQLSGANNAQWIGISSGATWDLSGATCDVTVEVDKFYHVKNVCWLFDGERRYQNLYVDGEAVGYAASTATTIADNAQRIFALGGVNDPTSYICHAKIASWMLTRDGTVIYEGVPCYRKSDGEPGMYDLVSGTFSTNAGSGTFVLGPSV